MRSDVTGKLLYFFIKLLKIIRFISGDSGKQYGISALKKLRLFLRIKSNNKKIVSLTTTMQLITLIEQIFAIPPTTEGDIVECGCFNGASTINLSLACALTHRKLFVCDSFEGLPAPAAEETYTVRSGDTYYEWKKGEFSSAGGLEEVKKNVKKWGDIKVCTFIKGFFNESLVNINTKSIVFIFEDVDLPSSVRDCIFYLWPKLQTGCRFYSHEPWSVDVVSLFYDKQFWKNSFNGMPPGFIGAGNSGFIVNALYCRLGYSEKIDPNKTIKHGARVIIPGSI